MNILLDYFLLTALYTFGFSLQRLRLLHKDIQFVLLNLETGNIPKLQKHLRSIISVLRFLCTWLYTLVALNKLQSAFSLKITIHVHYFNISGHVINTCPFLIKTEYHCLLTSFGWYHDFVLPAHQGTWTTDFIEFLHTFY